MLHHVEGLEGLLKGVEGMLKEGGLAVFTDLAREEGEVRIRFSNFLLGAFRYIIYS